MSTSLPVFLRTRSKTTVALPSSVVAVGPLKPRSEVVPLTVSVMVPPAKSSCAVATTGGRASSYGRLLPVSGAVSEPVCSAHNGVGHVTSDCRSLRLVETTNSSIRSPPAAPMSARGTMNVTTSPSWLAPLAGPASRVVPVDSMVYEVPSALLPNTESGPRATSNVKANEVSSSAGSSVCTWNATVSLSGSVTQMASRSTSGNSKSSSRTLPGSDSCRSPAGSVISGSDWVPAEAAGRASSRHNRKAVIRRMGFLGRALGGHRQRKRPMRARYS